MNIITITSCAMGIVHSYMAAEAIQRCAEKHGHSCRVEIQGALGIEDKLTDEEISSADLIIFANDVEIQEPERFAEVKDKIRQIPPHEVIRNPAVIYKK